MKRARPGDLLDIYEKRIDSIIAKSSSVHGYFNDCNTVHISILGHLQKNVLEQHQSILDADIVNQLNDFVKLWPALHGEMGHHSSDNDVMIALRKMGSVYKMTSSHPRKILNPRKSINLSNTSVPSNNVRSPELIIASLMEKESDVKRAKLLAQASQYRSLIPSISQRLKFIMEQLENNGHSMAPSQSCVPGGESRSLLINKADTNVKDIEVVTSMTYEASILTRVLDHLSKLSSI